MLIEQCAYGNRWRFVSPAAKAVFCLGGFVAAFAACRPEAAAAVFQSGIPIVMMPLDVTHQVLSTKARIAAIEQLGNRAGQVVAQMLSFSERFDLQKYGSDGAPLHDPCVIAYLLRPELFEGRHINVEIETRSELTMGATVADWWRVSGRPANTNFIRDIDAKGFFDLLTRRLGDLDRRLSQHNGQIPGGARYTRGRRPVRLLASRACAGKSTALRFEKSVKSRARAQKLQFLLSGEMV